MGEAFLQRCFMHFVAVNECKKYERWRKENTFFQINKNLRLRQDSSLCLTLTEVSCYPLYYSPHTAEGTKVFFYLYFPLSDKNVLLQTCVCVQPFESSLIWVYLVESSVSENVRSRPPLTVVNALLLPLRHVPTWRIQSFVPTTCHVYSLFLLDLLKQQKL